MSSIVNLSITGMPSYYNVVGGTSPGGSGSGTLPYDPVAVINGDSQGRGTADDQASYVASYVADPKVLILNTAGNFVQYNPGVAGASGIEYGADSTGVGPEIGFIRAFRAAYPGNTLRIIKEGNPGSFQSRGVTTGTVTASIAVNILTPTVGTVINNELLIGTGVTAGTYTIFSAGGGNTYVATIGQNNNGYLGGNVVSTSMTRYNATASWSSTEGCAYNGNSGHNDNGARTRLLTALAALTSAGKTPKIVCHMLILGTNDKSAASTGPLFQSETTAYITRMRSDWPMTNVPIVLARVMNSGTSVTQVRAAQQAVADADPLVFLLDMDAQILSADATHWRIAGLDYLGSGAYSCAFGLSPGI